MINNDVITIGDIIVLDVIYERNDTDYGDTVIGKEYDGV